MIFTPFSGPVLWTGKEKIMIETCCPSCGKAGIRLVAFTDAAAVLHMIGVGPMPCDSS